MPSKDYYKKMRLEAHDLYVREGLSNKEISERLKISEKSVSKWINDKDAQWKTERRMAVINSESQSKNRSEILYLIAEEKLELMNQIKKAKLDGDRELESELRKKSYALDNSVNSWRKDCKEQEKESRINLSVYLEIMERVFDAMKAFDPKLYYETLDFQESHIYDVTKLLG
jgi:transposase